MNSKSDAREQLVRYQNSADRKIIFLFIYMESSQRTCGESYAELKTFIADQNTRDLEIFFQASP